MSEETTKPYKYRAFGLNIQSEFEIPEFLPAQFEIPDVTIQFGNIPSYLENPEKKGLRYQLRDQEFLLWLDHIAGYYVQNGNSIQIKKYDTSTMQEVRLFLAGHVFVVLLYQRGFFALHANAIRSGDEAFLVCGNSGAGKSTLTREFMNAGYQLLSDDISVLEEQQENIYVQPAFPFIKLWKDSVEHLELDEVGGARLREQIDKYGFNLKDEFYDEVLPVKNIFVLVPHNKLEYKREQLKGIEKFNALKDSTYHFQFISDTLRPSHFELINKIAAQVTVHRITRPQAPINTVDLKAVIEELLE